MRIRILAIAVLNCLWVVPGSAQEINPFNLHVGGGIGVPVGSTAKFAGISGSFQVGAGPNLTRHNSLVGEFMWQGLPPNSSSLLPVLNPLIATGIAKGLSTSNNLYALTANYMFHVEGHRYGLYVIAGGGWYYRHSELKNYTVQPGIVCEPVWDWYGYTCVNGLVSSSNALVSHGQSSGGVNGGVGITMSLSSEPGVPKFYMEARYHYSPQGGRISTQVLPVAFGFRW